MVEATFEDEVDDAVALPELFCIVSVFVVVTIAVDVVAVAEDIDF